MSKGNSGARSQVVPHLVAALVADSSTTDPTTGKKTLVGIFDNLNAKKFPTTRPVSLYFKVTDAQGNYDLDVRFKRAGTDEILGRLTSDAPLLFKDRLSPLDFVFPLPPLNLPEAGQYTFEIWMNNMFVGSTSISAKRRNN